MASIRIRPIFSRRWCAIVPFAAILLLLPPVALSSAYASALTPMDSLESAPPISATDLDGVERSLAEFSGKVVVVNFWATWCPPCLSELPSMQRLWERFGDGDFVMLGVNVGEDRQTVLDFVQSFDTPIDYPLLTDDDLKVVKRWPVFGLPTTFVIDRKGRIVYKALGERDWADPGIEAAIVELIGSR